MRSPEESRQYLSRTILLIRGGHARSRRDLASHLGISPTTAGFYVDDLIRRGLVKETGLDRGASGRPKRRINTVPGAGWFAGIEFHAERLRAVAIDFTGQRCGGVRSAIPEACRADEVLDLAARAIRGLAKSSEGKLLGIGFASPGIVDPCRGVALTYAFLPDWREVPVAEHLAAAFRVPVTLENNLRVIALAERGFGGAKNLADYVILGPRSGFGVAVMQGGRLLRGAHEQAGEIGFWPWPCGRGGHWLHDSLTSRAVWHRLSGKGPRARPPGDLHAALAAFADGSGEGRAEVVADFARVLAMLHWLLDPEALFLHGPLTALGERFCKEINEAASALIPGDWNRVPELRLTILDDEAGALGAAALAMEGWSPA